MKNERTIKGLLDKFASDNENLSWRLNCAYSDGMYTNINQIEIYRHPGNRMIGVISYNDYTGSVLFCMFKRMRLSNTTEIVDVLLDMINYSKTH